MNNKIKLQLILISLIMICSPTFAEDPIEKKEYQGWNFYTGMFDFSDD